MSDIEKLKQMDPEEVYQKTYIAPKMVQALVEEDFKRIGNRSKALGFVKILERELGLDLSELRQKIEEYYGDAVEYSQAFAIDEKSHTQHKNPLLYLFVVAVVVIVGAVVGYRYLGHSQSKPTHQDFLAQSSSSSFDSFSPSSSSSMVASEINESNHFIQSLASSDEANLSFETNASEVTENNEREAIEEPAALPPPQIAIIPRKKLWVGIVYLDDYTRKNYITSAPIELNTSRDQLIVTGHGVLDIDIDGNITKYNSRHKLRFLYRAKELEPIDAITFKQYNRGKNW